MFGVAAPPLDLNRAMNPERPVVAKTDPQKPSVSGELVIRTLNYHGQQLTSFMKEKPMFQELELKNLDYHLYHQRSRELRMEDRGKRLLLHRFISQKSGKLFRELGRDQNSLLRHDNDQVEEHAALLPPFETFTDVHEDDRCRHFFDAVVPGDIIFCKVVQKSMSGLMLSVSCLDPITGKSRYIEDIKIRCFCPSAEMIPASDPKDPVRSYETGDTVRVVVLEVKVESQRLLAGMQSRSLGLELQSKVRLGLVQSADLPATLSYSSQAIERKIPYSVFLDKSVGFINPTNVAHLAEELGLDVKGDSLLADLGGKFNPRQCVGSIRREQASKWAFKHVAQGIKYFKSGNNVEAFQCLNQALNIDSENVEGLVARGALYANNGGLEKAVEDFETALRINPTHKNAKKYMCETLIAVARNHEDDNKVDSALEIYEKILRVVPDHKEALDSLYFLKGRPKDAPLRDGEPRRTDDKGEQESKNKPRLVLDDKEEKVNDRRRSRSEKKRKKRRKRSSRKSSSSSSSESSSSDSEDSRRRKKKKKKERKKSASRSMSPFKTKAGQKSATRALSPFSAKMNPISGGGGGVMNMPPECQTNSSSLLRNPSRLDMSDTETDLRADIERLKSKNSVDSEQKAVVLRLDSPAEQTVPALERGATEPQSGFPIIDLTQPPPGYPAMEPYPVHSGYQQYPHQTETEYDDKVRRFLQETEERGAGGYHGRRVDRDKQRERRSRSRERRRSRERESSLSKKRRSRRSRSNQRSGEDKSRNSKSVEVKRSRSKSATSRSRKSKSKEKKSRRSLSKSEKEKKQSKQSGRKSRDKDLLDDEEFAKKLDEQLSKGTRKKSRSESKDERKSRDNSTENQDRKGEKSKETDTELINIDTGIGKWKAVIGHGRKDGANESDKRKNEGHKPNVANVFDRLDMTDIPKGKRKSCESRKSVPPPTGGMWVPTGEDSILDGVNAAINRLEERRGSTGRSRKEDSPPSALPKWDPKGKIRMTTKAPPPDPDYEVTFDSRTGMYIRVPKQLTMAEKIAGQKVPEMDRKQTKESEVEQVEERIIRKISSSPPRLPFKRKETPSEERRSRSRERRSRSRDRRRSGRSRSRGRRDSRSKSREKRSRSRSRGRRSRSRGTKRSRSRSRHRSRKDTRHSYETIQQEISGMREETRRLQSERKAIEQEKALLLGGGVPGAVSYPPARGRGQASSRPGENREGPTSRPGESRDEFSGLDNVMNTVMEAVEGTKRKNNSPIAKPSKIIPGTETFEDLEAFIKRKKSEKLEELKKKK